MDENVMPNVTEAPVNVAAPDLKPVDTMRTRVEGLEREKINLSLQVHILWPSRHHSPNPCFLINDLPLRLPCTSDIPLQVHILEDKERASKAQFAKLEHKVILAADLLLLALPLRFSPFTCTSSYLPPFFLVVYLPRNSHSHDSVRVRLLLPH